MINFKDFIKKYKIVFKFDVGEYVVYKPENRIGVIAEHKTYGTSKERAHSIKTDEGYVIKMYNVKFGHVGRNCYEQDLEIYLPDISNKDKPAATDILDI